MADARRSETRGAKRPLSSASCRPAHACFRGSSSGVASNGTITGLARRGIFSDGSRKYLVRVGSDLVEASAFQGPDGWTACLSSQVGCPVGCVFCKTARIAHGRNLSASEMKAQLEAVSADLGQAPFRVSLSAQGEPLLNVSACLDATHACESRNMAFEFCTCGIPDGLERVLKESTASVTLTLHTCDSRKRARIMPLTADWPLDEVLSIWRREGKGRTLRISFALVDGWNDGVEEKESLVRISQSVDCEVELAALRFGTGLSIDKRAVAAFGSSLEASGVRVSYRTMVEPALVSMRGY